MGYPKRYGNIQISYNASGEGGLLKMSECRKLAKSSYSFYSGWKSLIHNSFCSIYGIRRGMKTSFGGRGWLKPSEYRHMGRV